MNPERQIHDGRQLLGTVRETSQGEFIAIKIGQLLIEAKRITPHGKFIPWVKHAGVGKITAERAPELLDREYDFKAWLQVMLDDIAADLPEFDGVTADLFGGGAP